MARKSSGNFDQKKYIQDYVREKYDQIHLQLPAGQREELKKAAEADGLSVNGYLKKLINAELSKTQKE